MSRGLIWQRRHGFTLVEVLAVLAIFAILAAIAVPGLVRLAVGSRDELQNTTRTLYAMLRAARVYAATHHVNTAVVYDLDRGVSSDGKALMDSVFPQRMVRVIRQAAIMYELPERPGYPGAWAHNYVPAPVPNGEFTPIGQNVVVDLRTFDTSLSDFVPILTLPPDQTDYTQDWPAALNCDQKCALAKAGLNTVKVVLNGTGPLAIESHADWLNAVNSGFPITTGTFLAHVFTPQGRMKPVNLQNSCSSSNNNNCDTPERFEIFVTYDPTLPPETRLINASLPALVDTNNQLNLLHRKIELFRSTARVRIAS